MSDVTEILSEIEAGNQKAASELLPIVYNELRKLATARMDNERADHTLQPTALVHDAYVRLIESPGGQSWENRGHFFAAAAESMRRILIESARAKKSKKRGGDHQRIDFDDFPNCSVDTSETLLDVDENLEKLAREDSESAELVKLRLFAGLSVTEAGQVLGMSRSTAYENWDFARSWFATHVSPDLP